jgi:alkylation response protein AidB-like acyl-CoA dehydrogenase
MNFEKSESHIAIENLSRQIFRGQVDDDYQKQWDLKRADSASDYDRALWSVLAEAGLLGVSVGDAWGGSAMGFVEMTAVLEAQGAVLAPVPLWSSLVAAAAIETFGSSQQCDQLLPAYVQGQSHFALALANTRQVSTISVVQGGLQGQCYDVPWAADASVVLPFNEADGTCSLYLLSADSKNLKLDRQMASNGEAHYRMILEGVPLGEANILGQRGQGEGIIEWINQRAYTALAALQLGVLEEALSRTAEYTGERKQFKKPIAAFQAVSHRAANAYIDREALRTCIWQAAWNLSDGQDATAEARTAKWWACEAGHRIAHTAQHLHGGIGADLEYPIHRYFLWAKQLEFTLGGAQEQLASLGSQLAQQNHLGAKI